MKVLDLITCKSYIFLGFRERSMSNVMTHESRQVSFLLAKEKEVIFVIGPWNSMIFSDNPRICAKPYPVHA